MMLYVKVRALARSIRALFYLSALDFVSDYSDTPASSDRTQTNTTSKSTTQLQLKEFNYQVILAGSGMDVKFRFGPKKYVPHKVNNTL